MNEDESVNKPFIKYDKNQFGKDYVCGDIHGCKVKLDEALDAVGFQKSVDRLFCVGDLGDRGTDSFGMYEYLVEDWFYSVMGNHEHMLLTAWVSQAMQDIWLHIRNGGDWFYNLQERFQIMYVDAIKNLPMGIQVGDVGIVHADYPWFQWDIDMLNKIWQSDTVEWEYFEHQLLWSRLTITREQHAGVSGIDKIYLGHSIQSYVKQIENLNFIDTGSFLPDGKITVIEI